MRKKNFVVRRKRAIAVRKKLYDTAIALFINEGYDNVSIDEVCKKVGVTKGAFYGHFKSKDQIVLERMASYDIAFSTELLPQVSDMEPGLAKLMAYIRLVMKYMNSVTRKLIRLSYAIRVSHTSKPLVITSKRELYVVLERLIREGQLCGEIRDDLSSAQIATIVLYNIVGLVFSWCLPGARFDIEKTGDHLLNILQPGLQKQ